MPVFCVSEASEIYAVELYRKVRLACADRMSRRQATRHFNLSCKNPVRRPKLESFITIIEGWFEDDTKVLAKQHNTAKRILDHLRDEHGFTRGYTIVKDHVREWEQRKREMFVPLAHRPVQAEADSGEAVVIIRGIEQKAHSFLRWTCREAMALSSELIGSARRRWR